MRGIAVAVLVLLFDMALAEAFIWFYESVSKTLALLIVGVLAFLMIFFATAAYPVFYNLFIWREDDEEKESN